MTWNEFWHQKKNWPQKNLPLDACSMRVASSLDAWVCQKEMTKVSEKCIFQPLHNDTKSVLSIKESYSMKKRPKIFTNAFGQADRKKTFWFWRLSLANAQKTPWGLSFTWIALVLWNYGRWFINKALFHLTSIIIASNYNCI